MNTHRTTTRNYPLAIIMVALIITAAAGAAHLFSEAAADAYGSTALGKALATEQTTTAPVVLPACEVVSPGSADVAEGINPDFYSFRDYVSEDGALSYDGRGDKVGVWSLARWDGSTEILGYASAEDSTIWNADHCPLAR